MRGTPVVIDRLDGGVDLDDPKLPQAEDLLNVIATGDGGIMRRPGAIAFASTAHTMGSLYATRGLNPNRLLAVPVVGSGSTTMYEISSLGVVNGYAAMPWGSGVWEFVEAPVSGGMGPVFALGYDPSTLAPFTPRYFDGFTVGDWTLAVGGAPPKGKFMRYVQNRVLIGGLVATFGAATSAQIKSRLYASKIQDPRVFASPDGWTVDLDAEDGQLLSGIGTIGQYALVFKESKAWVVYDLDTGANRKLSDTVGCVSHRSIVETPKGTFFLARDGIYVTDGTTVKHVSKPIQPLLDLLRGTQKAMASGVFYRNRYRLSIPDTSPEVSRFEIDYDLETDTWWIHDGAAVVHRYAILPDANGTDALYGARAGTTGIVRLASGSDLTDAGGVGFASYWNTPPLDFGSPSVKKRLRQLDVVGRGVVGVQHARDGTRLAGEGAPDTTLTLTLDNEGVALADGELATSSYFTPTNGVARMHGFQFAAQGESEMLIEQLALSIVPRKS